MGWLDPLIKRTVEAAIEDVLPRHIEAAVDRAIETNPRFRFCKAMQMEMLRCDPKMNPRDAWNTAVAALCNFLADEKIGFGDPRFDWSRYGADTLIHEYEIRHWERAQ